ncbi:MAG: SDR family NAD(P)-dependent oxidoreductase [Candidatus Marinimicrobia bacterium]|nr:SDR family NAD(P)-dependent oxidoreductase [Candidatus Neomarinimicrobiota bacterium]
MTDSNKFIQGKTCLITGATSGIGKVTAGELARLGGHIVIVSRSEEKCQRTAESINEEIGVEHVNYIVADLSVMENVRQAAEEYKESYDNLDVLVNNAGAYFTSRNETPDGFERTFALNHLSYFVLTHELLGLLTTNGPARIINVASDAHRGNKITFDDLNREEKYSGFHVYGESKLANIMFTYALDRRLSDTNVSVNAVHPGFVASGFGKNNSLPVRILMSVFHLFARSPEKGAETSIYLASSSDVGGESGKYYVDKKAKRSSKASYDEEAQERLWEVSKEMTGIESF